MRIKTEKKVTALEVLAVVLFWFKVHCGPGELRNWYNQIYIKPPTTKGKTDKYKKATTKWTDGKQSWQPFYKKVETLLLKFLTEYIINLHNC